ncbi:MAG TPA: serine hydrolase [Anaerolineales bacterium]
MRNRNRNIWLRGISILFVSVAIVMTAVSLVDYSRQRNNYPPAMTIAGVPVGGLEPGAASQRLLEVYTSPVEAHYGDAVIQIDPGVVGFKPDVESMLAAADLLRTGGAFWGGYWNFLWNRDPSPAAVPLRATIEEDRLRAYLQNEIAPRYDLPSTPAQPIPGGTSFTPGTPGQTLDIDRAVVLIEDALRSPSTRTVSLTFQQSSLTRPTLDNLEILLKQIVTVSEFDGLIGLYMADLQTGQEIHFAMNGGQEISDEPDVAFTASSTIKIPILISYFVQHGKAPVDDSVDTKILNMIHRSDNVASDAVMAELDPDTGPLVVSANMSRIGLENTFMAGFFYPGAPLLQRFDTPANQRFDIFNEPDVYNQTTATDMGTLLVDLFQCSDSGGGALVAAFPDKMDQAVCQHIIDYLLADKVGALIEAGVPEGTRVAHKHGWIPENDGVVRNFSDAAIVYSPGGNFVLTIYTYHPVQLIFPDVGDRIGTNRFFANLTQAVYNYFNLTSQ